MIDRLSVPALLLAGVLSAGCTGSSRADHALGEPYVRGPVESFTHHATASSLLVRAAPGSREPCGISATVDARTRYYERGAAGALRDVPRSAIAVGDTVEVHVEGDVAESCPVQARAPVVVRVGGARR